MTRRSFAAPVLLAALATGVAAGCGGDDGATRAAAADHAGAAVYRDLGCASCHGRNLQGTRGAPALEELDRHWSEAELVEYLQNPSRVQAETPRLQTLDRRYSMSMPGAAQVDRARLAELARYLLES